VALLERLMGVDELVYGPKLPVHQFSALASEFARGRFTVEEFQLGVEALSGEGLRPEDVAELVAIAGTVNGNGAAKLARVAEIDHVLLLAENGRVDSYSTPTRVRTRLQI
jgi:hypothetical protein